MHRLSAPFGRTLVLESLGALVALVTSEQPGSGIARDESGLQLYGFSFLCALNPNANLEGVGAGETPEEGDPLPFGEFCRATRPPC